MKIQKTKEKQAKIKEEKRLQQEKKRNMIKNLYTDNLCYIDIGYIRHLIGDVVQLARGSDYAAMVMHEFYKTIDKIKKKGGHMK